MHTISEIQQFIPQKAPIVMLSRLIYADQRTVRTELDIREDNIFVEAGKLWPPGIIENIAQSVASRAGYLASLQNEAPPLGFIGAIQDLTILSLPRVGECLETQVDLEHEIMNASIVSGTVRVDGIPIATCKMKIFEPQKI